ncbi:MAG TPA: porphobilinogen synthase, partial [Candidatus Dormibacteraeota bacterium]|nr:porphobilinogen synthase [Candidatus Dormibacteraeota bacterium]
VQQALRAIRGAVGDEIVCMADACLDEYTDHGHCGLLTAAGTIDNDATIAAYGQVAVSQAAAGADVIGPSGMMDGQVAAIRAALDDAGFPEVAVMAYAAKFASAFYGPFREAAGSSPRFGDRRSHQLDVANGREALREVALDIEEGADLVMVKPALTALDVVAAVRRAFPHPLGAYCVSGEYAMLRLAAAAGAFDEAQAMREAHLAIKRAGADFILTYAALELAAALRAEG